MAISKIVLNSTTQIDLTDTTATAGDVAQGKYFYGADGVKTEGTATGGTGGITQDANGYLVLDSEGDSDALYPLTNSRQDGVTTGNILIQEKDGHVKITFPNTISGSYFFINLTDAIANTAAASSINNRQKWFDIPTGSLVHSVSNVSNTSNITWNANFRNLSNSSLAYGIGDGTHETGTTITATVTTTQSVGCYFLYIDLSTVTLNAVLEFDASLIINGVRYF